MFRLTYLNHKLRRDEQMAMNTDQFTSRTLQTVYQSNAAKISWRAVRCLIYEFRYDGQYQQSVF
jgi:hypothetical protein